MYIRNMEEDYSPIVLAKKTRQLLDTIKSVYNHVYPSIDPRYIPRCKKMLHDAESAWHIVAIQWPDPTKAAVEQFNDIVMEISTFFGAKAVRSALTYQAQFM